MVVRACNTPRDATAVVSANTRQSKADHRGRWPRIAAAAAAAELAAPTHVKHVISRYQMDMRRLTRRSLVFEHFLPIEADRRRLTKEALTEVDVE